MVNGMSVLVDFCNSSSQPVSAFRRDYTTAVNGIVYTDVPTISNESSAPALSRDR